jgi:uncharacterized protein (TIGR03437 family)
VKRTCLTIILSAMAILFSAPAAAAETYTATVALSTASEVPPIQNLNASGTTFLTINVVRDATGNIVTGSVNFLTTFSFPASISITGHHIHEGASTVNGLVRINTAISGSSPLVFANGKGMINISVTGVDPAVLGRLLANPAGFYVNLHTTDNAGGAIRGQITTLIETLADTVAMTTASEVPPVTNVSASGTGTITVNPKRDPATGTITGGSVTFTVSFNFPGAVTFTGLHIHQAPAGTNGSVVINTGISGANSVTSASGTGILNYTVPNLSATLLQNLLNNPAGFYVNLHTTTQASGVIRGQLVSFSTPPGIEQVSPVVVQTGSNSTLTLTGTGFGTTAAVLVNGQIVPAVYDGTNNPSQLTNVPIPAALLASPGTLTVQVQDISGRLSTPRTITVAAAANLNSVAATTVDPVRYQTAVAPESIGALFGTNLATTTVTAASVPLPTSLDGTSVYVNGVAAPLFFVSPGQINYQIPPGVAPGTANVVVVDKNGNVSQGQVNVVPSIASIFTMKPDGTGAPAGLAAQNTATPVFNLALGNPDGTPVQLDLGANGVIVALFATGLRFAPNTDRSALNGVAESVSITIGGTAVTPGPLFAGPQGTFVGVDQINFIIPTSFAGKGEVDMVVTVDGKASNTLRINLK